MTEQLVTGVWDDPPPKRKGRYDWDSLSQTLRDNPMKWRKVFEKDRTSIAVALRQGSIRVLAPDLGYEVRTGNNVRGEPRTCTLWLRYNPEKDVSK